MKTQKAGQKKTANQKEAEYQRRFEKPQIASEAHRVEKQKEEEEEEKEQEQVEQEEEEKKKTTAV